jgi:hypothetical protein
MKLAKKIVLEIILLLASVVIFRGVWMLLDKIAATKSTGALAAMLVLGVLVTALILYCFHKNEN